MNKTRKIFSIILAVIMVLSVIPVASFAADSDFVIENGVLKEYKGAGGDIVIPDSVTSIGEYAFYYCYSITSVTIPGSVTSIGKYAFQGCYFTSVTIGNGVPSIGDFAFYNCPSLTSIEIPDSVTSIGEYAFYNCYSLPSITIPDGVTSIGSHAFDDCYSLTSVTIPAGVTSIGTAAFNYCTNITVDENNPVYDSRDNCNAIIKTATNTLVGGCIGTTIPDSVTSIGDSAFYYCTDLKGIDFPDNVTSIGNYAFAGCYDLTDVTIGNGVTSIGNYAFYYCSDLTSVTIPDSVTSIGNYAFEYCSKLTSITIPDSVTSIGFGILEICPAIESITIDENNPVYDSRNNCNAIIETATNTLIGGCKNTIIPDSVTKIDNYAFKDCSGLTSIEIPDSVTEIGPCAFLNCTGLTSIEISDKVTSIGMHAFNSCSNLKDVYYGGTEEQWNEIKIESYNNELLNANIHFTETPATCDFLEYKIVDGEVTITGYNDKTPAELVIPSEIEGCPVTSIGMEAFAFCDTITSVEIPGSVKNINIYAFGYSSITSVTIGNGLTTIGQYVFYGCNNLTSVTIPDSVTTIKALAFFNCENLTSVTIPDSVTTIGSEAFGGGDSIASITVDEKNPVYDSRDNCNAIIETATNTLILGCQNTTIPNSVTSIGNSAFASCGSITSIEIPDNITSIGELAFAGCSSLTSITVDENNTVYDSRDNCNAIIETETNKLVCGCSSTTIPDSVTSIGDSAFVSCDKLTSIEIPDGVTSIGVEVFNNCSHLESIKIPAGVTSIDVYAFMGCDSLTDVYYGGTEAQWNEINIMERNEALLNANIHFAELSEKDKAIAEIIASMGEDPSDAVKAAAEAAIAAINAAETDEEIAAAQKEGVKNVNNAKSEIVSVTEITEAMVGSYVTLEVLFTKSVQKLQFVDKNGNTITFDPTSENTLGIVDNEDGTQTWTIEIKVYHQTDTYNLHAKNNVTGWSEKNFEYTITDNHEYKTEVQSFEMPAEAAHGNRFLVGRHDITVKTGTDVMKVQIVFNGATATYTKDSTNATVTEEDGCLVWKLNYNFSTVGNGLVYTIRTRTYATSFEDAGTFTVDVLR